MYVEGNHHQAAIDAQNHVNNVRPGSEEAIVSATTVNPKKLYWKRFSEHFSQWKNLKILIATSMTWFLLDIGYYGTNLNTSIVLTAIGFTDKSSPYRDIYTTCLGQLSIF